MSTQVESGTTHMVDHLSTAYRMELETVINYLSNSIHLDGMLAEEVKRSLGGDVEEELGHAKELAHRIKQLGGRIPGSLELEFDQQSLAPPEHSTDVRYVIQGVIEAERSAIDHYRKIIALAEEEHDPVTADLATRLLADEEKHRVQFEGFLAACDTQ